MSHAVVGVSQKALAARLGVSTATVSLALAGDVRVAESTRERVRAEARAAGYRPDALLSALSARGGRGRSAPRSASFAVLAPSASLAVSSRHLHRLRTELARAGRTWGFRAEAVAIDRTGVTPERLGEILLHRGVDGLVLGGRPPEAFMERFPWARFAVVSVSSQLREHPFDHLAVDHMEACEQAWTVLRAGRWERISVCLNGEVDLNLQRRLSHHWAGIMRAEPRRFVGAEPLCCDPRDAGGRLRALFDRERPDLLVLQDERIIKAAAEAGLRFPRDCAAVGLGVSEEDPGMAGVRHSYEELARRVWSVLATKLRTGERGESAHRMRVLLRGEWAQGASLPEGE